MGDQSASVGLCMLDYKSLRIAVMIWATWLTDRHTETDRQTTFDRLYTISSPAELKSKNQSYVMFLCRVFRF